MTNGWQSLLDLVTEDEMPYLFSEEKEVELYQTGSVTITFAERTFVVTVDATEITKSVKEMTRG